MLLHEIDRLHVLTVSLKSYPSTSWIGYTNLFGGIILIRVSFSPPHTHIYTSSGLSPPSHSHMNKHTLPPSPRLVSTCILTGSLDGCGRKHPTLPLPLLPWQHRPRQMLAVVSVPWPCLRTKCPSKQIAPKTTHITTSWSVVAQTEILMALICFYSLSPVGCNHSVNQSVSHSVSHSASQSVAVSNVMYFAFPCSISSRYIESLNFMYSNSVFLRCPLTTLSQLCLALSLGAASYSQSGIVKGIKVLDETLKAVWTTGWGLRRGTNGIKKERKQTWKKYLE